MTDANGQMTMAIPERNIRIHARVTCLVVAGNRAGIGGVVTASSTPEVSEGQSMLMGVADNQALDLPDVLVSIIRGPGEDRNCAEPLTELGSGVPVEHGNITVRDGSLT
jgi:hypothetical protein